LIAEVYHASGKLVAETLPAAQRDKAAVRADADAHARISAVDVDVLAALAIGAVGNGAREVDDL
jgi:predicted nuclease with RNAse H fold